MAYIAYAAAWIATSAAVSIAVWITKSASPLWAMLIPSLISFSTTKKSKDEE